MIAYIDASVLIRIILQHPRPLPEWDEITLGVSSALLVVECHRALDQLVHRGELSETDVAEKRSLLDLFVPRLGILQLDQQVLDTACLPLPTNLATLDAIHLATANIYRDKQPDDEPPLSFATHDRALAKAARAMRFEVIGA